MGKSPPRVAGGVAVELDAVIRFGRFPGRVETTKVYPVADGDRFHVAVSDVELKLTIEATDVVARLTGILASVDDDPSGPHGPHSIPSQAITKP